MPTNSQRLRNGDLAIVTFAGAIVRAHSGTITVHSANVPAARAESVAEDEAGALLITYQNGTVYRLYEDKLTQLTEGDGLPQARGRCALVNDRAGRLWFAKGREVGVFHEGRFETITHVDDPVTRIAPAGDGGLWIASGQNILRNHSTGTSELIARLPASSSAVFCHRPPRRQRRGSLGGNLDQRFASLRGGTL